jgi:hypothetical protein
MLLREILGPPRAMQPLESDPQGSQGGPTQGSQDREPQRASVKTQNGHHQNGHAQHGAASALVTEELARPALPGANAEQQTAAPSATMTPSLGPGEPETPQEPPHVPPPGATTAPSQAGVTSGLSDALDASVGALRRFLRWVGIWQ